MDNPLSVEGKINQMMSGRSKQAQSAADQIILVRESGSIERIGSNGFYHRNHQKIMVEPRHQCYVFSVVGQFNSFGLSNPKQNFGICCDYRNNYFEYQGIRIPINYVPELLKIFNHYHSQINN